MKLSLLVLKTKNLLELKLFYETLGFEFKQEQHGNGPIHFSSEFGDLVFELYPLKDNESQTTSGVRIGFDVKNLSLIKLNLEKYYPKSIIKEELNFLLIQDLDNRKIELKTFLA